MSYAVNEIFYSLQGEGVRAGTPAIFVRFSGCNRQCRMLPGPLSIGGFDCDTEHEEHELMTANEILARCLALSDMDDWIVLTGGEPALQLDSKLIETLKLSYRLAIETNGTIKLPEGLDWITVSPKAPDEDIKQRTADEVKYVLSYGQTLPSVVVDARYRLLSPAFDGSKVDADTLGWCVGLVLANRGWRLSAQQHKGWGIR